jgi:hypothetical protein
MQAKMRQIIETRVLFVLLCENFPAVSRGISLRLQVAVLELRLLA